MGTGLKGLGKILIEIMTVGSIFPGKQDSRSIWRGGRQRLDESLLLLATAHIGNTLEEESTQPSG